VSLTDEIAKLPHHCQGCPKRWNGYNTGHCKVCHETFSGITAFDKHRVNGKCRPPAEVGLVESKRAYPCWGFPSDDGYWEVG